MGCGPQTPSPLSTHIRNPAPASACPGSKQNGTQRSIYLGSRRVDSGIGVLAGAVHARNKKGCIVLSRYLKEVANMFGPFLKALLEKGDAKLYEEQFGKEGMAKSKEVENVMGLEKRLENLDMEERGKFLVYSENLTG